MRHLFSLSRSLFLLVLSAVVVACGTEGGPAKLPTVPVETPLQTVLDWFNSINRHDLPLALVHFAPVDRPEMHWSDFYSTSFNDVHCQTIWQGEFKAALSCTFTVTNPAPDMLNINAWGVDVSRRPAGPWLITSYGQG